MLNLIWFIPLLPLAGAILNLILGRKFGDPRSGWVATIATGTSFLVTALVYFEMLGLEAEERSHVEVLFSWLPVGSLQVDFALLADPLSIVMALFITGISTLIHLYAIGYMHGDAKFSKFFLYLNLFVFSMLMLVMGENRPAPPRSRHASHWLAQRAYRARLRGGPAAFCRNRPQRLSWAQFLPRFRGGNAHPPARANRRRDSLLWPTGENI